MDPSELKTLRRAWWSMTLTQMQAVWPRLLVYIDGLQAAQARLDTLVANLPACRHVIDWDSQTQCGEPATHGYGSGYVCDEHVGGQYPLPYIDALRAILKSRQ